MARFTLPRDIYFGKGALENLKSLKGKKAMEKLLKCCYYDTEVDF